MSVFELNFGSTDERVEAKLKSVGPRLLRELLPAMNAQMLALESYVKTRKLEGDPLHHRTGKLQSSVQALPAVVDAGVIAGGVYQAQAVAPYGIVHEYGGTFEIPEHTRRIGFDARGRRVKLLTRHGLVSQRKQIASVGEGIVRAHTATFPERSFMRSSLLENADKILEAMEQALTEVLKGDAS